jgi:pyridoxamine 5'-phosphate oxidase family protein
MSFTEDEITYLRSQRLARISTVSANGQPDVVPVGYEFNGTHFYIGGINQTKTRKYTNVLAGNVKVALVIDDLVSADPYIPRYLRVYGTAKLVERRDHLGTGPHIRITPIISWSWNLDGRPFTYDRQDLPRRTVHEIATD